MWPFRPPPVQRPIDQLRLEFEREKHRDDVELRRRELSLKEQQERRATWHSPLFLAVIAALVGLFSNAVVAWLNGKMQRDLERQKAEGARVIEALKTGDPDTAAENLRLLVDANLVPESAADIDKYLRTREAGEGAQLPAGDGNAELRPNVAPTRMTTNVTFCPEYLKHGAPRAERQFCRVGYALGFDTKRRLAAWVIYRLSTSRTNPPRRRGQDRWFFDPELPENVQAGPEVYSQNEWDRGHLIYRPNATWNDDLYNELWLYSVAAPQHEKLNRETWSDLEQLTSEAIAGEKVKELYVINGPIFGPTTQRAYRGLVDIPDGYYRVVYDPEQNRVAAWVVPNGPSAEATYPGTAGVADAVERYLVSVDAIERITGLDFLSTLPDAVETSLEAKAGSVAWLR